MDSQSDQQLVQVACAGDRDAFGILAQRYHDMVLRVAYRMVDHDDIVHDLAQETVLQAYLSLKQLRDPSRFRSWLYGITLNVCREFLRTQPAWIVSFESLMGGIHIADAMPSPETVVERIELRQRVQYALQMLTDDNRVVVILYYYEGFNTREIADMLDISTSAVKTRLYKARQQLKVYFEAVLPDVQPKPKGKRKMIPVTIVDVISQTHQDTDGNTFQQYQVVLFDQASHRALVIWIGQLEATTIALGLTNAMPDTGFTPRPMTQQFVMNLIQSTGATVESIEISKLLDRVFYATVRLATDNGDRREIDARPSDALSLAVWNNIPIYIASDVMEQAAIAIPEGLKATQKGANAILDKIRETISLQKAWSEKQREEAETPPQTMDSSIIEAVFEATTGQ